MAKIDELIDRANELGMPEVAAVLVFTKDNGTGSTIRLLATVDRHANAAGLIRSLRTAGPLHKAVMRVKDRPWANSERPWLDLDVARQAELAAARALVGLGSLA